MLTTLALIGLVIFLSTQLSALSTTIYLHRTMAHKGIRLHPFVASFMKVQLWIFTGIVVREWVAVHRKHHHFADVEGDPHSPHLKGLWNVLLWNAVYYAKEANKPDVVEKYTRDMPATRPDIVLSNGWMGLATGMAVFITGFTLWFGGWIGPVVGAAAFVAQGVYYIISNAVINGACHVIGYKNYKNTATNIKAVAWLTAGEGLHNNHHQYPAAAKMSMRRGEFDPAWPFIWLMSKLRLAHPLPLPNENENSLGYAAQ